jgi:hypothetical protein
VKNHEKWVKCLLELTSGDDFSAISAYCPDDP